MFRLIDIGTNEGNRLYTSPVLIPKASAGGYKEVLFGGVRAFFMGWEYHERKRDAFGRFADEGKKDQIHMRIAPEQAERIRARALCLHKDITAYLMDLVQIDMMRDCELVE